MVLWGITRRIMITVCKKSFSHCILLVLEVWIDVHFGTVQIFFLFYLNLLNRHSIKSLYSTSQYFVTLKLCSSWSN